MILSSQLGDFAAVSDLLKATEAPLLGCRDVTEPSIKPSRHVVGILNVNIQKGKNAERENHAKMIRTCCVFRLMKFHAQHGDVTLLRHTIPH